MAAVLEREAIAADEWVRVNPLASVSGLAGVRVHNVGQGDAVSLLDLQDREILRIDYGGRESSPFARTPRHRRMGVIDAALPVPDGQPILLSHWDEDHWCSSRPGGQAERLGHWLTPRQMTSPRAVRASARMKTVRCFPEGLGQTAVCFEALNGDELWCQKLAVFKAGDAGEDCNRSGLAFSIVSQTFAEVVLLPGDAPFQHISHFEDHDPQRYSLRGLLAYHHGSRTHWSAETVRSLRRWSSPRGAQDVVFSCGDPNGYDHPHDNLYAAALPRARLRRTASASALDIRFGP